MSMPTRRKLTHKREFILKLCPAGFAVCSAARPDTAGINSGENRKLQEIE